MGWPSWCCSAASLVWPDFFEAATSVSTSFFATDIEDQQRKGEELEIEVAGRTAVAEARAVQVRNLAMELTETEQRERSRLARVLHDDLQQLLVAIKTQISLIGKKEGVAKERAFVEGLLPQAIETSRSLSKDLAPPVLCYEGLGAALEWLAESSRERYGLNVDVQTDESGAAESHWLRVFLFEVVRELLLNVVKHACTLQVRLVLNRAEGVIRLLVEDAGKGFATGEVKPSTEHGSGLTFMQHRVALIGGKMEIESAPGKGTRITVTVPLNESAPVGQETDVSGPQALPENTSRRMDLPCRSLRA
jgi:signal transduction histidine kinase